MTDDSSRTNDGFFFLIWCLLGTCIGTKLIEANFQKQPPWCSIEKAVLKISQNSQENANLIVSFLIKFRSEVWEQLFNKTLPATASKCFHLPLGTFEVKMNKNSYALQNISREIFQNFPGKHSQCSFFKQSF